MFYFYFLQNRGYGFDLVHDGSIIANKGPYNIKIGAIIFYWPGGGQASVPHFNFSSVGFSEIRPHYQCP